MALATFARLRSAVTGGVQPVVPPVPVKLPPQGQTDWTSRIARTVNTMLGGKLNCAVDVVLTADETSTVVVDSRIGVWSVILPMPASSSAKDAMASLWIVTQQGQATIHHASDPATDQNFRLAIFG